MSDRNYGFLTPKRREYLQMSEEERKCIYTDDQRHQMDLSIRRHAAQSLKDLILVTKSTSKKDVVKIFDIDGVSFLVQQILTRRSHDGLEEYSGKKLFYQEFLDRLRITLLNSELKATGQRFTLEYGASGFGAAMLKDVDEYLKD